MALRRPLSLKPPVDDYSSTDCSRLRDSLCPHAGLSLTHAGLIKITFAYLINCSADIIRNMRHPPLIIIKCRLFLNHFWSISSIRIVLIRLICPRVDWVSLTLFNCNAQLNNIQLISKPLIKAESRGLPLGLLEKKILFLFWKQKSNDLLRLLPSQTLSFSVQNESDLRQNFVGFFLCPSCHSKFHLAQCVCILLLTKRQRSHKSAPALSLECGGMLCVLTASLLLFIYILFRVLPIDVTKRNWTSRLLAPCEFKGSGRRCFSSLISLICDLERLEENFSPLYNL